MEKRTLTLGAAAAVLAALYIAYFTDWFRRETIQVMCQPRKIAQRVDAKRNLETVPVFPMVFGFLSKYEFSSVKVCKTEELRRERFPTPVWHIIAETSSPPIKAIVYGVAPPGMRPVVEDSQPEALSPGVSYTVQVEAGSIKGEASFTPEMARLTR